MIKCCLKLFPIAGLKYTIENFIPTDDVILTGSKNLGGVVEEMQGRACNEIAFLVLQDRHNFSTIFATTTSMNASEILYAINDNKTSP